MPLFEKPKQLSRFGKTEQGRNKMNAIKSHLNGLIKSMAQGAPGREKVAKLELYNEMDAELRKAIEVADKKYNKKRE